MSVRRAQREIDSREFAEWMAYHELDPFGGERGDLQAGIIAATLANVNRSKGTQPYKPGDFMPKFGERVKRISSPEGMKALLKNIAKNFGVVSERGESR